MSTFDGVFPQARFITIHPLLLDITDGNYVSAAILHEIEWRGRDTETGARINDGWVTKTLTEWATILRTTENRVRAAITDCGPMIERTQLSTSTWNRTASMRVSRDQVIAAIDGRCGIPQIEECKGTDRAAVGHRSSTTEEPLEELFEEVVDAEASTHTPDQSSPKSNEAKKRAWSDRVNNLTSAYRAEYERRRGMKCPQSQMVVAKIVARFEELDDPTLKRAMWAAPTISIRALEIAVSNLRAPSQGKGASGGSGMDQMRRVHQNMFGNNPDAGTPSGRKTVIDIPVPANLTKGLPR